ncbi:hypothetical protein ANANG_G00093920 [Anguilla anguilla]|uniref:Tetratricopeptide repeat-containing protein n=1 Tax=Anguilla anguilla TaxID=7936 RepID=A0A9D3MMB7_ANGAN|nr:hypothetical protein ANANG_G00093920 [Anguilla anguilla]
MRGLQSKYFQEDDYGTSIRKKQSASWALKCVKIGVDHFKSGRHVDAMNEYNKALEIDTNNVEALVARGALYATKGSLVKAMGDFELALEACPTHRNAKKYLCQTLVEHGGQLEEQEKLVTAEGLYRKALALDETFQEAEEALKKLQLRIQKSLKRKEEEEAAREERESQCVETSAEKLRKILKEEKRMKRKRRRSSSSSSTSSTTSSSSSSSSSSSYRKSKKRKRKHRRSSRSHRKRHRRVSSRDAKEDCYPAPANTSASFLCQKQEVAKLLGEPERPEDSGRSYAKGRRSRLSTSSPSVGIADARRGRCEDNPVFGAGEGGREKDPCEEEFGPLASPRSREVRAGERRLSGREKEEAGVQRRAEEERGPYENARGRKCSESSTGSEYSRRSDWPAKEHPARAAAAEGLTAAGTNPPRAPTGNWRARELQTAAGRVTVRGRPAGTRIKACRQTFWTSSAR